MPSKKKTASRRPRTAGTKGRAKTQMAHTTSLAKNSPKPLSSASAGERWFAACKRGDLTAKLRTSKKAADADARQHLEETGHSVDVVAATGKRAAKSAAKKSTAQASTRKPHVMSSAENVDIGTWGPEE